MSISARFLRFNLVGALGVAVQLGALALLDRVLPTHYLAASSLAVELAVVHNFAWHIRYTWPESRSGGLAVPLLRFHLSNGLTSLLGNLLFMRLLVQGAHIPALAANAISIPCCGVANFLLAHHWAFQRNLAEGIAARALGP